VYRRLPHYMLWRRINMLKAHMEVLRMPARHQAAEVAGTRFRLPTSTPCVNTR
jgi:hypothetical protein